MPAATEGMITGCRPSLRCSRTTAVRDFAAIWPTNTNGCYTQSRVKLSGSYAFGRLCPFTASILRRDQ